MNSTPASPEFDETDSGGGVSCCKPDVGLQVATGLTIAGVLSILAKFVAMVALADGADPHWRGQAATPPAPGELTIAERVTASWTVLDEPHAGKAYRTRVGWRYERVTTGAIYHHEVKEEEQTNIHVTEEVKVVTPSTVGAGDSLWARSTFTRPDSTLFRGPDLYSFALFQAPQGLGFVVPLTDHGVGYDDSAGDGTYTGGLNLRDAAPVLKRAGQDVYGTWRIFVFAQDVNRVAPGTPPEIAAQTIGGFVVASGTQITFDPDLPCPLEVQASIKVV